MADIKSILQSLGYRLSDDGAKYWRARPIYRNGHNPTALRISKKTGWFTDFAQNDSGPFPKLIQLSLGLSAYEEAKKWLSDKDFTLLPDDYEKPKITMSEKFDIKMLDRLLKVHTYWNKRGISTETIEQFRGGLASEGRMANRYVFPIFNKQEEIVGFSGRDITGNSQIKWKHIGDKLKWLFPLHLNRENILAADEVILVESIGDLLKLWETGFNNSLCLFGTSISPSLLTSVAGFPIKKIYISTNNDFDNDFVGNKHAAEIYTRMLSLVDPSKIQVKLPIKNDFGEMTPDEILKWKNHLNIGVVGGRDFADREKLNNVLSSIDKDIGMIVSGGAPGADTLAEQWALENKMPFVKFEPQWDKYGKRAAFVRNEHIVRNCDFLIAFHDGRSHGTANSIDIAQKLNKPLQIVRY